MDIRKFDSASTYDLYEIIMKGKSLLSDCMSSLALLEKKQVAALLRYVAEYGPPNKKTNKFNSLGENVYELKTKNGIRIFCFFGGPVLPDTLILCHGIKKPKPKVLQREKEKVIHLRKKYLAEGRIIK